MEKCISSLLNPKSNVSIIVLNEETELLLVALTFPKWKTSQYTFVTSIFFNQDIDDIIDISSILVFFKLKLVKVGQLSLTKS